MSKMLIDRAVVEQLLEALETPIHEQSFMQKQNAITNLRAALAEPVQEPFCYVYEYDSPYGLHREFYPREYNGMKPSRTVPLYTAPPQRPAEPVTDKCICNHSPLTDDQLDDIAVAARRGNLYDLRIAIERALKIGGTE